MNGIQPSAGAQTVDRASTLLRAVVRADEPISFVDLLDECDLPKSTTSRLLAALEGNELLERDADGCYVAGPLFWLYATRHDPWEELVRLAQPTLNRVGHELRETVHLSVSRGDRVVQIAQVESEYLLGSRDWSSVDVPVHASALGKVLGAHNLIEIPAGPLERFTDETVVSSTRFAHQLKEIRARGWAQTNDEFEIGLSSIAAPVRGGNGQVVAALGISGPTPRIKGHEGEVGKSLIAYTEQLSGLLRRQRKASKKGIA